MKAITKYLMMMIAMLAMCVSFSSCRDEEEDLSGDTTIGNFVVEYSASGGGFDAVELSQIVKGFEEAYGKYLTGRQTNEAIYIFDENVKAIRGLYKNGDKDIIGKLTITMKLLNESGKVIRTGYIYITAEGSEYKI